LLVHSLSFTILHGDLSVQHREDIRVSVNLSAESFPFDSLPQAGTGQRLLASKDPGLRELLPSNDLQWKEITEQRRLNPSLRDNDLLNEIVAMQEQWGGTKKSIENAHALKDPSTFCIVTGQQPGLLLGPMFTLYKVLTAIALANKVEAEVGGVRVVPVFWNESADSDLPEIDSTCLLDKEGNPSRFTLDLKNIPNGTAIGSLPIDLADLNNVTEWMSHALPGTEYLADILSMLGETYRESSRLSEWFNRSLHQLLRDSGLVIFESSQIQFKELTSPIWQRYLDEQGLLNTQLSKTEASLEAIGIPPRLKKQQEETGWFVVKNGIRAPIRFKEGNLEANGESISLKDLTANIATEVKPSAALRPLVQDLLLPNIATIVGPHEFEYHLQLQAVYEENEVFRPKVLSRFGGMIVESKVSRFLEESQLEPMDLLSPKRELEKRLCRNTDGQNIVSLIEQAREELAGLFDNLTPLVKDMGEDLLSPITKNERKMEDGLKSLEDLLVRRLSRQDDILRGRLERAKSSLFPEDNLQERVLSPFYFLIKYGPDFLDQLQRCVTDSLDSPTRFNLIRIS